MRRNNTSFNVKTDVYRVPASPPSAQLLPIGGMVLVRFTAPCRTAMDSSRSAHEMFWWKPPASLTIVLN